MKFNRCLLLSLLLFVVLLPAFINAKKCATYGKCNYFKKNEIFLIPKAERSEKECDEKTCYAFQCLDKDGRVMMGAGCYDDFVNACKWISPDAKLNARAPRYTYRNYSENYVLCSGTNHTRNFAIRALNSYLKNEEVENLFGSGHNSSSSDKCEYDNTPKPPPAATLQCQSFGVCSNLLKFGEVSAVAKETKSVVQCDREACVVFICTFDEGKKIMYGGGCLNEFERVCTNVPADAKKKIRENKNDYFYNDNTTVLVTCSNGDNCVKAAYDEYTKNNPFFFEMDRTYDGSCTYPPPPLVTTITEKSGANGFEFSGMILFGLSFIRLLL